MNITRIVNFEYSPCFISMRIKYKSQGTLCREKTGECDVKEYCTGDSGVVS